MEKTLQEKIEFHISNYIKDHGTNLHKNFKFRPGQKEAIVDIVNTFFDDKRKLHVLSAPTGSGKSQVALCAAYILNKLGKKGYILTSDLSLFDQYVEDINKYKLGYGYVKGIDNYECTENGEKHSLGECKLKNLNAYDTKQLDCYRECPYFFARDYASVSDVSLMTYSLYLIHMNYVLPRVENPPFDERDFIICDEAHKVLNIVQKHFSPTIDENTYPMLERLRTFLAEKSMAIAYSGNEIKSILNKIFNEEDKEKLFIYNKQFEKMLGSFVNHADEVKKFVGRKYNGRKVPKEWRKGLNLCDWVKDVHCKFEDYNHIIAKTDIRAIIKNQSDTTIQFNCINEKYLMKKHFWENTNFTGMMSATIGDPSTFVKSIKGPSAKYRKIPNSFNFDKSPIYVYQGLSMSYKNKNDSFPRMIEKIDEILDRHPHENGIIHTGSYANSKRIFEDSRHQNRILRYSDASDKKDLLFDFNNRDNSVLMGPSILEGINLFDEKSRFQIIAKVPYASIADRFVAAKMKIDPPWYNWQTIINILQGIGRSIRHKDDFAVTYILDGDFIQLWRRNRHHFPDEFNDRMIFPRF
mgnify:CR=1 FL=1